MRKSRIVVIGSSNTDLIIKLDRLPQPGETRIGGEFASAPGGKGANQAVAAARAGGEVTLVARVGSDALGDEAIAGFRRDGINARHVARDRNSPSGTALILVDGGGRNLIAVASGANARLTIADVKRACEALAGADALILQLESPLPAIEAAATLAVQRGVPVILNPAPARPLPDRLLAKVSILTPNETEAEVLTGIKVNSDHAAARAADRLLTRGASTIIITLGRRGAFVASGAIRERVAGFRTRAIDTTAAGDVFNGAVAVALGEKRALRDAVRFANAAAAISVTRLGAQPSAPTRTEIDRLLRG